MRRKIVAGNWKLHGSRQFATELLGQVAAGLPKSGVEVVILPPMPYLGELVEDFARPPGLWCTGRQQQREGRLHR